MSAILPTVVYSFAAFLCWRHLIAKVGAYQTFSIAIRYRRYIVHIVSKVCNASIVYQIMTKITYCEPGLCYIYILSNCKLGCDNQISKQITADNFCFTNDSPLLSKPKKNNSNILLARHLLIQRRVKFTVTLVDFVWHICISATFFHLSGKSCLHHHLHL